MVATASVRLYQYCEFELSILARSTSGSKNYKTYNCRYTDFESDNVSNRQPSVMRRQSMQQFPIPVLR